MEVVKLLLVLAITLITLLSALLLNYGAKQSDFFTINAAVIICVVIIINIIKFKAWGVVYKRYKLSESYPLVSLFFPLVYGVAIYNGEAQFELLKSLGVILILLGVYVLSLKA